MKILLIHNQYIHKGGEDTVFEAEYDLLVKKGHSVQKLLFDNKQLSAGGRVALLWKLFFNLDTFKKINKIIEECNPDIIHVHNFFPIVSPSIFFSAKKYNIPTVMTLHNYRLICPNALMFRDHKVCELCIHHKFAFNSIVYSCYRNSKIQTLLLSTMLYFHKLAGTWGKKIDRYITLTKFAKTKFLYSSLNVSDSQFLIKPNFTVDNGYDLNKEDYCLFVGRLSEEKGIDVLLKAFEKSQRKLVIIGDGPLKEKVQQCAYENHNVQYLGFQPRELIVKQMKKAKALVFTSILYETFGMTIIEAFSCATPVVCSDIGAPAEIVREGLTGLKFQMGEHEELKKKIDFIYENEILHHELCKNARREYEDKYTADKNYKQLLKIYEDVINEKI